MHSGDSGAQTLSWRLCAATGMSAVGGGTILVRGIDLLPFGTVAAFLMGGCVSLLVVRWHAPERAGMMAIIAAAFTLALLTLHALGLIDLHAESIRGGLAVAVFTVLCLRYAFWFAARILRADVLAGHGQKIARVEVAYYAGLIGGFALGQLGFVPTLTQALVVDATLLIVAGWIDFLSRGLWDGAKSLGEVQPQVAGGETRSISIYAVMVVSCVSVGLFVVVGAGEPTTTNSIVALLLLLIGALTYEALATVFLDSMGDDRKREEQGDENSVAKAYCVMAIVGAIFLWGLRELPTAVWIGVCVLVVPAVVWSAVAWPMRTGSNGESGVSSGGMWWRKTTVLVALTTGAQIVPFTAVIAERSTLGGGYILATFYAGAALGGMWSSVRKPKLVVNGGSVGARMGYRVGRLE